MKKNIYIFGLIILCIIFGIMSNINVYAISNMNRIENSISSENNSKENEDELRELILNTNSNQINEILDSGRDKTMQIAKEKTYEVFKKVGFGRY